ncbi:MAG: hypothetical protein AMXMBFR84_36900 [Candidatus Hydrogenedentota bacterium]
MKKTESVRWSLMALCCFVTVAGAVADRYDEPPIEYSKADDSNAVSQMAADLADGTLVLERSAPFGYLKPLLAYLGVPQESQVLVFSKTSLQTRFISPDSPRAIYFNDDIYVGAVKYSGTIEISTADPKLGTAFYTLSEHESGRPMITRQTDNCLQCHASTLTDGFPGHIVRSVYPDAEGFPILQAGTHVTTHESPFVERWGGWYVTGTHGSMRHMGNSIAVPTEYAAEIDTEAGANRTDLTHVADLGDYLTPHSDIVALMVLEHQTRMHNLMTSADFETRLALRDQAIMDEALNRSGGELSESTQRRIASAGSKLVDYLLFAREVPLKSAIAGTSGFAEWFTAQGPRDSLGRSVREFDLRTRLFKYPLSYLIYSAQFDALPVEMREYVYARLWGILTGGADAERYPHLDEGTRKAIRQILAETKTNLSSHWKAD